MAMSKLNLQKREKIVLGCGAGAVVLLAAYLLMQRPINEYKRSVEALTRARQCQALAEGWREEVRSARGGQEELAQRIRARGPRFDLWTHIGSALRAAQLQDRGDFESKRSVLSSGALAEVELTLRGVTMEELVDLLHRIYAGDNLVVLYKLTHIRAENDGKGLSCQMTWISPRPQKP